MLSQSSKTRARQSSEDGCAILVPYGTRQLILLVYRADQSRRRHTACQCLIRDWSCFALPALVYAVLFMIWFKSETPLTTVATVNDVRFRQYIRLYVDRPTGPAAVLRNFRRAKEQSFERSQLGGKEAILYCCALFIFFLEFRWW